MWCCCFFFFKQKTAYEMRISDWSSDVCSSDLQSSGCRIAHRDRLVGGYPRAVDQRPIAQQIGSAERDPRHLRLCGQIRQRGHAAPPSLASARSSMSSPSSSTASRSDEHTSVLQSLMRISYSVFCFNNKNNISNRITKLNPAIKT